MYRFITIIAALVGILVLQLQPPALLDTPCINQGQESEVASSNFDAEEFAEREFDLVVYGATGFTGKLVVEYLSESYPSLKLGLGGRNMKKLKEQIKSYKLSNATPFQAGSDDKAALKRIAEKTRVVIALAGPYVLYGSTLVEACAESGTNYVDLSGEFFFHREIIDKFQSKAERTGAKLVIAGGYDSVPFDLGASLVVRDLNPNPTSLIRIRSVVTEAHGGMSGGTFASMKKGVKDMITGVWGGEMSLAHANDPYITVPEIKDCMKVDTEATGWGSLPRIDSVLDIFAVPHFMAYCNSRIVRRTMYFNIKSKVSYMEGMSLASFWDAFWWSLPHWWRGEMPLAPKPGEGPGSTIRKEGGFRAKVVGSPDDATGSKVEYDIVGHGDPGYAFTSKTIAEVGICLGLESCHEHFGRGGVYTVGSALKLNEVRNRLEEAKHDGKPLLKFTKIE